MTTSRTKKSLPAPIETRREAIAAAAIELLAMHGAWGLSHRAIDKWLQFPMGSTSYYFRTRQALLEAAENLVFERDLACMLENTEPSGRIQGELLIQRWTAPDMRSTVLARLELMLEASRNPLLQAQMQVHRKHFLQKVKTAISAQENAVVTDAAIQANVAQFEGELLQRLAFGPPHTERSSQR